MQLETSDSWVLSSPVPQDGHKYEVWMRGGVRRVQRMDNASNYFAPGTLVFTDCTHPMQNAICDETQVDGWRIQP